MRAPNFRHQRSKKRRHPRRTARLREQRPAAQIQTLEDRTLLAVSLTLNGVQSIVPGPAVNASDDNGINHAEVSIDVNPTNPLNLAGVHTNAGVVEVFSSFDGGATWSTLFFGAEDGSGPGGSRFDPSIAFDDDGELYVAYARGNILDDMGNFLTTLVVAHSGDGGQSFDNFEFVDVRSDANGVAAPPGIDKLHLATGPDGLGGQAVYVTYSHVVFTANGGTAEARIMVSGSNDQGATWTIPVEISDTSINGSNENIFADPAVGPNGELYIVWNDLDDNKVYMDRDINGLFIGGHTWGTDRVIVEPDGGVLFKTPVPAQPARGIFTGPVIDIDRSGGPDHGTLYVSYVEWEDQANDDTDVKVARSKNGGNTWIPFTVDFSTGTEFLPWVDVDQTTGSVNVLYLTTDGNEAGDLENIRPRLSSSFDGGTSWVTVQNFSEMQSNEGEGFTTDEDYLEYNGLAVHDGTAHAFWTSIHSAAGIFKDVFAAGAAYHSASSNNTLTITGPGDSLIDVITVRRSAANDDFLEVFIDGQREFTGLASTIDRINIFGADTNDFITVEGLPDDVELFIATGGGNDTVILDDDETGLGSFKTLEVDAGGGDDRVIARLGDLTTGERGTRIDIDPGPAGDRETVDVRIGSVTGDGPLRVMTEEIEMVIERLEKGIATDRNSLVALNYERDPRGFVDLQADVRDAAIWDDGYWHLKFRDQQEGNNRAGAQPDAMRLRLQIENNTATGATTKTEWNPGLRNERLAARFEATPQSDDLDSRVVGWLRMRPDDANLGHTIDVRIDGLTLPGEQRSDGRAITPSFHREWVFDTSTPQAKGRKTVRAHDFPATDEPPVGEQVRYRAGATGGELRRFDLDAAGVDDVVVDIAASTPIESAKVNVRGWNPEKKEAFVGDAERFEIDASNLSAGRMRITRGPALPSRFLLSEAIADVFDVNVGGVNDYRHKVVGGRFGKYRQRITGTDDDDTLRLIAEDVTVGPGGWSTRTFTGSGDDSVFAKEAGLRSDGELVQAVSDNVHEMGNGNDRFNGRYFLTGVTHVLDVDGGAGRDSITGVVKVVDPDRGGEPDDLRFRTSTSALEETFFKFIDVPLIGDLTSRASTSRAGGSLTVPLTYTATLNVPSDDAASALDINTFGMTETRLVNRLPADANGDSDRPFVVGSVYNGPPPGNAEPAPHFGAEVRAVPDRRSLERAVIDLVTTTNSPYVETSLITRNLPDLDYRHTGPGGQRLGLEFADLMEPVKLFVGTAPLDANRAGDGASKRDLIRLSGFGTFETGTLDLDLVSPPREPMMAAIAIPNLLDARASANESAIVVEPGLTPLDVALKSETTTPAVHHEYLLVASKVKEAIRGGHLQLIQSANSQGGYDSAMLLDGVEVGGDFVARMNSHQNHSSEIPVIPNAATLGFSNVTFRESTANVRFVGDWAESNLRLQDVQVIDSRLNLTHRPDDTPAAGMSVKPLYDRVVVQRENESESSISHRIEGTRFADSFLVGAFDVFVDDGARFRMHADSKAGDDEVFGILDFEPEANGQTRKSRGFGFVTFKSGADADDVTMAVFHGENFARLMASVDTGPGDDTVGVTRGVTLANRDDYERTGPPNDRDDLDLETHIQRMRNLFQDPDELTYQRLLEETQVDRRYLYFAKTGD